MNFRVHSLQDMAINAIEMRAIEHIRQHDVGLAMMLLDDQLERDPSRAGIAKAIAAGANHPAYAATFGIMKMLHEAGDPDAFKKSHTEDQLVWRQERKSEIFNTQNPPKYTSSEKSVVTAAKKNQ